MKETTTPPPTTKFNPARQCCFCGAHHQPGCTIGYAGEPVCSACGKGGDGEPDEERMFYKERHV